MKFDLTLPDGRELSFEGDLLAEVSSKAHSRATRWSEVRIYRTDTGKHVTEVVGRSVEPGEVDRANIRVHPTLSTVVGGLSRKSGDRMFMTNLSAEALQIAASKDPTLAPLLG